MDSDGSAHFSLSFRTQLLKIFLLLASMHCVWIPAKIKWTELDFFFASHLVNSLVTYVSIHNKSSDPACLLISSFFSYYLFIQISLVFYINLNSDLPFFKLCNSSFLYVRLVCVKASHRRSFSAHQLNRASIFIHYCLHLISFNTLIASTFR